MEGLGGPSPPLSAGSERKLEMEEVQLCFRNKMQSNNNRARFVLQNISFFFLLFPQPVQQGTAFQSPISSPSTSQKTCVIRIRSGISALQVLLIALFIMQWIAACYSISQPLCDFGGGFCVWFCGFWGFFFLFSQEPVALRSVLYNGIIT